MLANKYSRSRLGPDLVFVILSMDKEEVRRRVKARHQGEEQAVDLMEVLKKFFHLINIVVFSQ